MPIMVVVFLGLSSVVVIAMCRAFDLQPRFDGSAPAEGDKKSRNRGMEIMLGPSEFLPQIQAKSDIADAVIRGEMSLIDAARAFREVSKSDPGFVQRMMTNYPDADEIEIYARSVISHVHVHLRKKSEQAPTIERLKAELADYIQQTQVNQPSASSIRPLE